MAGIENVLATRPTRLVMFESPTNPVTKVADIERLVELAHRHGALAVMDNTFAGFHQHGEYDIDVFVHSLTKYASGTGDVMGGAVIARSEIIEGMRPDFSVLGALLDPHAAFLVQRGLKTYFVRYREQTRAAQQVAEHLAAHPAVARVHYPGLPSHPQAALARKQMREAGTVVSFDLKKGSEAARHFSEGLKLFALTASLGSTESLVMPPQLVGSRDFTPEQARQSGVGPGTVRCRSAWRMSGISSRTSTRPWRKEWGHSPFARKRGMSPFLHHVTAHIATDTENCARFPTVSLC